LPKKPKGNEVAVTIPLKVEIDWFRCTDPFIVPMQIGGHANPLDPHNKVFYYFKDLKAVDEFLHEVREEAEYFMDDMEMNSLFFCDQKCSDCKERYENLTGRCSRGLILLAARCFCGKTELVIQDISSVPKESLICSICHTTLVRYGD